jgi:hydroxymethylbilane synthase
MTTEPLKLRLGTRASPLAMAQARLVRTALCAAHGWAEAAITLCPMTATGDRIVDRPLAEVGGKELWTRELDRALLSDEIDFAVHSMKDVETIRPAEIAIAAMLPRADVRDRLIGAESLDALRQGARVGTSSPRRRAQLLRLRPDLEIILFRGNVGTRLGKIDAGEADATLLAAAGLDRLDMIGVGADIPVDVMLPAPAQGAIGIEVRAGDERVSALVSAISDGLTMTCVQAERAFLAALSGDCRSPIAAHAGFEEGLITLAGEILSPDGTERQSDSARFPPEDAHSAAPALARALLDRASPALRALFGQ